MEERAVFINDYLDDAEDFGYNPRFARGGGWSRFATAYGYAPEAVRRAGRAGTIARMAIEDMGQSAYRLADNLYNFLIAANIDHVMNIDLTTPAYLLDLIRKGGQILTAGKALYGAGNDLYQFYNKTDEDMINESYDGFVRSVIDSGIDMPTDVGNYMDRLTSSAKLLSTDIENTAAQDLFNKNLKQAIYINYNDLLKTRRQLNDYSPEAMKKRVLGNYDGRKEIYLNRPDISDLGIIPHQAYKY